MTTTRIRTIFATLMLLLPPFFSLYCNKITIQHTRLKTYDEMKYR